MNIEDKARELVDSFYEYSEGYSDEGKQESAKECAMIAVNEMLKLTFYSSTEDNDYWKAVKYEIIKM